MFGKLFPWLLGGAVGTFLYWTMGTAHASTSTGPVIDPKTDFKDSRGFWWGLYQYKDGTWEGTLIDVNAPTSYAATFNAPTRAQVIAQIDGHALTFAA